MLYNACPSSSVVSTSISHTSGLKLVVHSSDLQTVVHHRWTMPQLMMLARLGEMQSQWKSPLSDESGLQSLAQFCSMLAVPKAEWAESNYYSNLKFQSTSAGCNEWRSIWVEKMYSSRKFKEGRDVFAILSGPHPSGPAWEDNVFKSHPNLRPVRWSVTISPNHYATELMLCKILPCQLAMGSTERTPSRRRGS